jgi:hypothetical protein
MESPGIRDIQDVKTTRESAAGAGGVHHPAALSLRIPTFLAQHPLSVQRHDG